MGANMAWMPADDQLSGDAEIGLETGYLSGEEITAGTHRRAGYQRLVQEAAIAVSYNDLSHAVMMATPEDLEDYAIGFSVSSGIVDHPRDILDIVVEHHCDTARLEITLVQRALHNLKRSRRTMAGSSGCGLCGVQALEQALTQPRRLKRSHCPLPPSPQLRGLRERFQHAQRSLRLSGAMHAALYVNASGETLLCREDIGRHNALDKLLGACLRQGIALEAGFVAVTSRCGLELVQKAACVGIGTLVSLSSLSDIGVRWTRESLLNLLHQTARESSRIYSPAPEYIEEP